MGVLEVGWVALWIIPVPGDSARVRAAASTIAELTTLLASAGFTHIRIRTKEGGRELVGGWLPGRGIEEFLASATIEAVKPAGFR